VQHSQRYMEASGSLIRYPGSVKTPMNTSDKRERLKATLTQYVVRDDREHGQHQLQIYGSRTANDPPSAYHQRDFGMPHTQQFSDNFPFDTNRNFGEPVHELKPPKLGPTHQHDSQNVYAVRHQSYLPQSNNQMVLYQQTPIAKSVPSYNQNFHAPNKGTHPNILPGYGIYQQSLNTLQQDWRNFQPNHTKFENNQQQNIAGPPTTQQSWSTSQMRYPDLQNFQQHLFPPTAVNTSFNYDPPEGGINQHNNSHYSAHSIPQYPQLQYHKVENQPQHNRLFEQNNHSERNTQFDHKFSSTVQIPGQWTQPQHLGINTYEYQFDSGEWKPNPSAQAATNVEFVAQQNLNHLTPYEPRNTSLQAAATFRGGNYNQTQNQAQQHPQNNTNLQGGYAVPQDLKHSTTFEAVDRVGNYGQTQNQLQQHHGNIANLQSGYAVPQSSNPSSMAQHSSLYSSPGGSYQQA
jgi:hypothetical protein